MGDAGFLLAVNIAVSLGFAAKFAAIAWFDRGRPAPAWLAAGFALGSSYAIGELIIATGVAPFPGHMIAAVGYVAALAAVAVGLGHHYERRIDPRIMGAVVLASVPLYGGLYLLARDDFLRQVLYQVPYVGLQLLAFLIVLGTRRDKTVLDRLLAAIILINALNTALRPFLAQWTGGVGARPEDYAHSLYALYSQTSGSILVLLMAVMTALVLASDIAGRLMARADYDLETGLLTRRAFEPRLAVALAGRQGPQALVMISHTPVDHDGRGEAAATERFVAALRQATAPWSVRARLGASDFAVLDPAANVFAARRAMAQLREACEGQFRLAIGIAETEAGDVPATALARGERALAQARLAGGDCVRIAPRSDLLGPDITGLQGFGPGGGGF